MAVAIRGKGNFYFKVGTDVLTQTKGDVSVSISNGEIETTTDSEVGFKTYIAGDYDATISGSFNYSDVSSSPDAQEAIFAASMTGATLAVSWGYEAPTSGVNVYSANVIVTSFGSTNGDPLTMSFTLRVQGEITTTVTA